MFIQMLQNKNVHTFIYKNATSKLKKNISFLIFNMMKAKAWCKVKLNLINLKFWEEG